MNTSDYLSEYQKRITYIITSLEYAGRQNQLVQLVTNLRKKNWEIQVISLLPPEALTEKFTNIGIPVFSLNMLKGVPDPRAIWRLHKIINRFNPTILHSHLIHAALLTRTTNYFLEKPVLVSTIGSIKEGGFLHEQLFRLTDPLCDITTNVSKIAVERFIKDGLSPAEKIHYIPNCVDTNIFYPQQQTRKYLRKKMQVDDKFVWLAVGRLNIPKDYPNMLEAFKQISYESSKVILLICGQGPEQEYIEELIERLGLQNKVYLLGVRSDIADIMNIADGFVMSSAWEGMPGVLLEASATGLPIVATNVSGNSEVVLDKKSGFLVEPRNSESLAIAMQDLMSAPQYVRKEMGNIGRNYVIKNFDFQSVTPEWENLYRNLIHSRKISS